MDTKGAPYGEIRLQEVLDAIVAEGDTQESDFLEAKVDVNLKTPLGQAKVAKFILGAANRMPQQANKNMQGYAVFVIGTKQGQALGIRKGTEAHDLLDQLKKFLGPDGPRFDLARIAVSEDNEVLFVIVNPPENGQPPFPCHSDYFPDDKKLSKHALRDGAIYRRDQTSTRNATAVQVLELVSRAKDVGPPAMELAVDLGGGIRHIENIDFLRDQWLEIAANDYKEKFKNRHLSRSLRVMPTIQMPGQVRAPQSEKEVEERLSQWRSRFRQRWSELSDELIGASFPGAQLRVVNRAEVFLSKPEIVVRVHGCRAVGVHERPSLGDILLPIDEPSMAYLNMRVPHIAPLNREIEWVNKGEGVLITATPSALRPDTPWASDNDEFVLVLNGPESESIQVDWSVTAEGYGKRLTGEFFTPAKEVANAVDLVHRLN